MSHKRCCIPVFGNGHDTAPARLCTDSLHDAATVEQAVSTELRRVFIAGADLSLFAGLSLGVDCFMGLNQWGALHFKCINCVIDSIIVSPAACLHPPPPRVSEPGSRACVCPSSSRPTPGAQAVSVPRLVWTQPGPMSPCPPPILIVGVLAVSVCCSLTQGLTNVGSALCGTHCECGRDPRLRK